MPNANVLALEKIRTERARQKLLEQELERRQSELIDAGAVDQSVAEVGRKLRARWVTWPARMAPKLAARFGCDERKAFDVLDRLVREQIDQLPRWRGCGVEIGLDAGVARQIDAGFAAADTRGPGGGRKPLSVKCGPARAIQNAAERPPSIGR